MAKKRTSREGYKGRFKVYAAEDRANKNKAKKLARHLMKHPNDSQSAERRTPASYKRKKPLDNWEKLGNSSAEYSKKKTFSRR